MNRTATAFENKGIMEQVRILFESGYTSGGIISMGFAPPTVYKVQSQLKKRDQRFGGISALGIAQSQTATTPGRSTWNLEAQNARLKKEVEELTLKLETASDQLSELDKMKSEREVEFEALQERVNILEPEAMAAGQLRLSLKGLEGKIQREVHTTTAVSQNAVRWQTKLQAEQAARLTAEEQREMWHNKTQQLERDNQKLQADAGKRQQIIEKTNQMLIALVAEVKELRPLKVWAGHPCKHCKKPLSGAVSREDAAKLMEDFGHPECNKKHSGSGVGWLIAGSAALAALSQNKKRS